MHPFPFAGSSVRQQATRHRTRRIVRVCSVLSVIAALGASPAYAASPSGPATATSPNLPGQQVQGMLPAGALDAVSDSSRGAALPRAATTPGYVLGTDVSSYQHPGGQAINWAAVAASGETFTVVKATEATSYTNPYVLADVTGARAAGLFVGVYHFAHPEISATAQADYLSREVNGIGGAMLPPVLDLEQTGGLSSTALIAWTSAFLARVTQDTGRVPMIYSGPYFWSTAMAGSRAFTRYRLWEAHYTTAAQPQAIAGWPTWTLWQYSNGSFGAPAPVPGIPAHVDRDRVAGTKAQLAALVSSSRPGVQPPFTGTATASQYPDSTFVQVVGDSRVYEIAGRAPLWVTSWTHVGGRHPVRSVSLASFRTLRSAPMEGTFLFDRTDGHAYRVVGGAPVIVTNWAAFGGPQHSVTIDDWDIVHAGSCNGYCHLSMTPRDGTIVRAVESNEVYVVAGSAPIYVSTWSAFGGPQPFLDLNEAAIRNAGLGTFWNHLVFVPVDGTMISDSSTGELYLVTGGHPQLASTAISANMPFTLVGHSAITNAGGTGVWAHLR
jgi:lysozyme